MEKIVLASNNPHKIQEFKQILSEYEILSLKDIGFHDEIEESGKTFLENATIKAETIFQFLKKQHINAIVMADDSGLCVEALNGAPGVYTARYSGVNASSAANRAKLLKNLNGENNRNAYFVCTIVEIFPDGRHIHAEGKTYGKILTEEIGDNSFGYDCLFFSDDLKKSFGLATAEEKNSISHRARAIQKIKELQNNK